MSEKGILKKIDDIFNYCEEIDNHLPKEEQTGYRMLPDIFYIQKEVHKLQQKVEQLEKENEKLKYLADDSKTMKAFIVEHKKVEQLENIRKEAIKLLKKCGIVDEKGNFNAYLDTIELKDLLNILNKGDNNVKDKR